MTTSLFSLSLSLSRCPLSQVLGNRKPRVLSTRPRFRSSTRTFSTSRTPKSPTPLFLVFMGFRFLSLSLSPSLSLSALSLSLFSLAILCLRCWGNANHVLFRPGHDFVLRHGFSTSRTPKSPTPLLLVSWVLVFELFFFCFFFVFSLSLFFFPFFFYPLSLSLYLSPLSRSFVCF